MLSNTYLCLPIQTGWICTMVERVQFSFVRLKFQLYSIRPLKMAAIYSNHLLQSCNLLRKYQIHFSVFKSGFLNVCFQYNYRNLETIQNYLSITQLLGSNSCVICTYIQKAVETERRSNYKVEKASSQPFHVAVASSRYTLVWFIGMYLH